MESLIQGIAASPFDRSVSGRLSHNKFARSVQHALGLQVMRVKHSAWKGIPQNAHSWAKMSACPSNMMLEQQKHLLGAYQESRRDDIRSEWSGKPSYNALMSKHHVDTLLRLAPVYRLTCTLVFGITKRKVPQSSAC